MNGTRSWRPGSPTGFKFIDPDGAFAEPAFDLAIPMREWGSVMPEGDVVRLGRDRCGLLAKFAGVEHQPIWEWGLIQLVWNGLLLHRIGVVEPASVSLAIADAWSAAGDSVSPCQLLDGPEQVPGGEGFLHVEVAGIERLTRMVDWQAADQQDPNIGPQTAGAMGDIEAVEVRLEIDVRDQHVRWA